MKQELIKALTGCGYVEGKTLFLQGTFNPADPYPDEFVTFWTNYTEDGSHYDNTVNSIDWNFTVYLYSSDAEIVNKKPAQIISALKKAGFIPQGKGSDLPSDEPTHTGWVMEFKKSEKT